jgi:hypothetical protein
VVVSTPHELDGVTDGCVHGEGDVTEDTLGRGDDNGVGSASASAACGLSSGWGSLVLDGSLAVGSNALCSNVSIATGD